MPLELLDYPVFRQQVNVTLSGEPVSIPCGPVPNDQVWRVDQVAVGVINFGAFDFLAPPNVALYDLFPGPNILPVQATELSEYTLGESQFWADWDDQGSPITIRGGDQLTVVFNGVGPPMICLLRVQYASFQGVAGQPQPIAGGTPGPAVPVGI